MIDIFDRHKASKTPSTMAESFYFDEKSPEAKYLTELLQEEDAKLSYLCDSVIDCFYKQHKQFHKIEKHTFRHVYRFYAKRTLRERLDKGNTGTSTLFLVYPHINYMMN
jgi:hypothetical protein